MEKKKETTSWEGVSSWYDQTVGKTGHYYHEKIILPKISSLLEGKEAKNAPSVLDLACGQGILSRHVSEETEYVGVDISASLLTSAKTHNKKKKHRFLLADITKPLSLEKKDFAFCTIILALQNLQNPLIALKNAYAHLSIGGKLILVMNHPCFRIPRQSSWGVDLENKIQYRRIDKYGSSLTIPIQANPSQGKNSKQTFSFHHPLAKWSLWLKEAGFMIEEIDEWHSDKKSTGKHAKMEDRSRIEIPMFLCIVAQKLSQ